MRKLILPAIVLPLTLTACDDFPLWTSKKKTKPYSTIVSGTPEYISLCSAEWLNKTYPSYHRNSKIDDNGEVYILTNNGMDAKYIPIDHDRLVVDIMANKRSVGNQATTAARLCAKKQQKQ